jgi:hypothetical protein
MAKGLAGATASAHMGLPNAAAAHSRDNRGQARSAPGGVFLFSFDSRRRLWQCRRPNPLSPQDFRAGQQPDNKEPQVGQT